jgi:hypothetical protein
MTDVYKGLLAGACDSIQSEIGGHAILPAYAPINDNSLLQSWNPTDRRPYYFSSNGLRLSNFESIYRTRSWIRSFRPDDAGWPVQVAGMGYCVSADGTDADAFYCCAGYNAINELRTLAGENLYDGSKTFNEALPVALRAGAMSYYQSHIYFSGGYDLSLDTYSDILYRITSIPDDNNDLVGWTAVATLPYPVQRHSQCVWNDHLVIAGGRDSSGYKTDVYVYNIAAGTWTKKADLSVARGWHCAAVYGNFLYIFGGWTGGTTLSSVEKINLSTGAVTFTTSLPFSRAEQAIAVNGSVAYLISGRTGSSTVQNDLYAYDMSTDTVTTVAYDMAQSSSPVDHDEPPPIPEPFVMSGAAFYHPLDDYIGIVGGVEESGAISFRIWEYHFDDNLMYLRKADESKWGYLRPLAHYTGSAGDAFTLNVAVRNATDITHEINPYCRLTILIGPVSDPIRKVRSGYFVPPQDDFRTYTLPFVLQDGETEFRAYIRHYGGNTKVDIAAFQVVPAMVSGFIVPVEGGGGGALVERFRTPINPAVTLGNGVWNADRSASGTFCCIFGSQQNISQKIFSFTCEADSYLTLAEVWYDVAEDYSDGVVTSTTYPDLIAYPPTGRLYLKWQLRDGAVTETDIFAEATFELNHARLNREWRLDLVDWQISSFSGDCWVEFSYYGYYTRIDLVTGIEAYILERYDYLNSVYDEIRHFKTEIASEKVEFGVHVSGITCENSGVIMSVSRSIASIIESICGEAGLSSSEYDTSGVSGNVQGYATAQLTAARSLLDPLRSAFAFDAIESGGVLKFKSRASTASVISIDEEDLVPYDKGVLQVASRQEAEMPRKVSVSYIDPALTYQQNTQTASRDSSFDIATESAMSLPFVMSATDAMNAAEMLLSSSWQGRYTFTFKTTFKYIHLEPSDVVTLNVGSFAHTMLITGKSISPGGFCEFEADQYSIGTYNQDGVGTPGPVDLQTITKRQATLWQELDIPILLEKDDNPGFYVALYNDTATDGKWGGAAFYASTDALIYSAVAKVGVAATVGEAATLIGQPVSENVFDYANTVDVELFTGALTTASKTAVLNGANLLLLGTEIIQFTTSTLVSGSTYRLSGLLRARFGTQTTGHAIGERAILVGDGIARYNPGTSGIGIDRYYKGVTVKGNFDAVSFSTFKNTAKGLKPYAPCHLSGTRNGSGDLIITWVRRARVNGHWANEVDVPLGEASESYGVQIMNGSAIVRGLTVNAPTVTYTAAQQIADFGSLQASVDVRVYQKSAVVGAGYLKSGTL